MKKNLLLLLSAVILLPWCLNAQTFPTLSQADGETVWYSIYSGRAGLVLKDNGAGNEVTTADLEDATETEINALKWKFLATGETIEGAAVFKIVSKLGNELYYEQFQPAPNNDGKYRYDEDDEVYKTSESNTGELDLYDRFLTKSQSSNTFIFKQYNDDNGFTFQIWANDVSYVIDPEPDEDEIVGSYINKTNNDEDICIYEVDNDAGNPFSAINTMQDIYDVKYPNAPQLSTEANPVWYQILSMRSGKVFANVGDDLPVEQQDAAIGTSLEKDAQLYRFEGTYSKFKVISKIGGGLAHVSSPDNRIIISETTHYFRFEPTPWQAHVGKWALVHREKGTGINETSKTACLYGINDEGSVVDFIADDFNWFEGAPELSTASAPKWYALKNSRANRFLTDELGIDWLLFTKDLVEEAGEEQDKQLFRFEGEYENFKIISKSGAYLKAVTGSWTIAADPDPIQITDALRITAAETGDEFTFARSTNTEYGNNNAWAIKDLTTTGSNGNALNANGGKEYEVTLYGSGDGGSVWEFIKAENIGKEESFVPQIDVNLRTQLFVSANTLTVKAENMSSITIYNLTGTKIMHSLVNNSFEYTMPSAGCYIVSVTYNDAKTENLKFIIR